jgi:hypothetical protein
MDPTMTQNLTRRLRLPALAAALTLAVAACAGASMDSDLGPRYAVAVVNELPQAMIVSLDDGNSVRLLGTVAAESESRFVLDGAMGTTVTIIATDEEDTLTVRRTVVLEAGSSVEVRLN